ncbi:MAG: hypothetical protein Q3M30_01405 [Candidatus Electrothrix sp. Rat3]|nr:hypothetical protein [Candidatus Electrothrix rattekaaiensis]
MIADKELFALNRRFLVINKRLLATNKKLSVINRRCLLINEGVFAPERRLSLIKKRLLPSRGTGTFCLTARIYYRQEDGNFELLILLSGPHNKINRILLQIPLGVKKIDLRKFDHKGYWI